MRILRRSLSRRITRQGLSLVLVLVASASMAHAHGGMAGPDDLGPPLFTSAALAFVCYWVVILWPASKRKHSDDAPDGKKMRAHENRRRRASRSSKRASGQASRLRNVEANRARAGLGARGKASDV